MKGKRSVGRALRASTARVAGCPGIRSQTGGRGGNDSDLAGNRVADQQRDPSPFFKDMFRFLHRFGRIVPVLLLPVVLVLMLAMLPARRSTACAHVWASTPWPPYGMPHRPLRWGYLAYGSTMLPCDNWLARYYARRDKIREYPYCMYGARGLYNVRPKPSLHDIIYGSHKGPATDNDH
ncbi:uncharacterized protein LOC142796386 [Rhipicephalus microplus]|uniref:uncharacterized protein LOC142796386 n=1 Tax=Rhipicephalus microplus TaxID=6941 RepID=UPI003F6D702F